MRNTFYMLDLNVVHLEVLGEWLKLMVRIVMRVFLQMHKGFLQLRYV